MSTPIFYIELYNCSLKCIQSNLQIRTGRLQFKLELVLVAVTEQFSLDCASRLSSFWSFLCINIIYIQVGHDKQGLPIGLQLIGRPWGEATILRVASAVEVIIIFVPETINSEYLSILEESRLKWLWDTLFQAVSFYHMIPLQSLFLFTGKVYWKKANQPKELQQ